MSEFKNCPHCAAVDPVRIAYSSEEDNYDKANDDFMCVVCDVNKGGCGAASGYRATELEAVEAWNTRAHPKEAESVAWKHSLFYSDSEGCQSMLTDTMKNPFGVCGVDYDPTYWVISEPLYASPSPTSVAQPGAHGEPAQTSKCVCKEPNPERDPICGHYTRVNCEKFGNYILNSPEAE